MFLRFTQMCSEKQFLTFFFPYYDALLVTGILYSTSTEQVESINAILNISSLKPIVNCLFALLCFRGLNGYADANNRGQGLNKEPIVLYQKHGPLQTIFDLLPNEVCFLVIFWTLSC